MPNFKKSESLTTQIHQIYIKAPAEAIWDAITQPEWTTKYGYRCPVDYDLKPGGKYIVRSTDTMLAMGLPVIVLDGEVTEATRPNKLVHTLRFMFTDENVAEGFTRISWEIVPTGEGFCRLTVTHEMENAPIMAANTSSDYDGHGGGGWNWVISDLKSLLETGKALAD
ncbi:MAG TPA: SRPBCC domain-containing protein [Rhodocyclaceae bacterium]|nr:SRPBCC domain-containing protein [Rhodocyclaceae bacterium]